MSKFGAYKWLLFLCMYVGYFMYILCRKVFSFSMPAIMSQEGLSKDQLGNYTLKCKIWKSFLCVLRFI